MGRLSSVCLVILLVLVLGSVACGSVSGQVPAVSPTVNPACPAPENERVYLHELRVSLDVLFELFDWLAQVIRASTTDRTVYTDEDWKQELGDVLVAMIDESTILRSLNPPEEISYLHAYPSMTAGFISAMSTNLAEGVDNLDQEKLNAGGFELTQVEWALAKSWDGLSSYCGRLVQQHPSLRLPE